MTPEIENLMLGQRLIEKALGLAKPPTNGGCPPDCGHSDEEHAAFDRGVKDGLECGCEVECPIEYRGNFTLSEAWETGRSVNAKR